MDVTTLSHNLPGRALQLTIAILLAVLPGALSSLHAATGSTSFTTTHFAGSSNCSLCHDGLVDDGGNDVSLVHHWAATPMAHASRDPFWRAKMASETARLPALAAVIQDKCLTCHAPMGYTEAHLAAPDTLAAADGPTGILTPGHSLFDASMEGVGCTLCHQIQNIALGTGTSMSGGYTINPQRLIYGPYSNLMAQPMINNTGYTPIYSPHVLESELCATCHELFTPTVDAATGILTGTTFPEQTPFSEWLHSAYPAEGITCQRCHMPRAEGTLRISTRPPRQITERADVARHEFLGGNTFLSQLLARNPVELGVTSTGLTAQAQLQEQFLATQAAQLEVAAEHLDGDGTLELVLRVQVRTGHKFPTSFPSRRAWLHVTVTHTANGTTVFESGAHTPDGRIIGADGDEDLRAHEPHHRSITTERDVQIYEALMADTRGDLTYTLLEGATYLKDNRLLPAGFMRETAPDHILPRGAGVEGDDDFVGGSDTVTYRIEGLDPSREYVVRAALRYQVASSAMIADLRTDSELPAVQTFLDLLAITPPPVATIDELEIAVNTPPAFVRGDANTDGRLDISDAVHTLAYAFGGSQQSSCPDAADANDDGVIDIADPVMLLAYLFGGGPALPTPFAACGPDPTDDRLTCPSYRACQ